MKRIVPPVRAVTFDVGGTLLEVTPSVGHVYADVARKHGIRADPEALNRNFARAWKELAGFAYTSGEWAALVDSCFGPEVQPPPSRSFFPELYERFSDPEVWRVRQGAVDTFIRLRRAGIKLGVISNWDDRLRRLLDRLRLTPFFEVITISCEVGCCKPDPRIFNAAASAFGIPSASIVHVGDHPELDVRGAWKSGMQAVLIGDGLEGLSVERISTLPDLCEVLGLE